VADNKDQKLDELDISIMAHLQKNRRKTYRDIAKDLEVSEGTIRNRVKKLERNGAMSSDGLIEPFRIGFNTAATISVKIQPPFLDEAIKEISELSEVSTMIVIAGEYDLNIDVYCRDQDHLTEFITQRLQKVKGLAETQVAIMLRVLKYGELNLGLLRPTRVGPGDS
jgi:Lrp/AsnC family transcriptional regulator for asnA, asnC and gidA